MKDLKDLKKGDLVTLVEDSYGKKKLYEKTVLSVGKSYVSVQGYKFSVSEYRERWHMLYGKYGYITLYLGTKSDVEEYFALQKEIHNLCRYISDNVIKVDNVEVLRNIKGAIDSECNKEGK